MTNNISPKWRVALSALKRTFPLGPLKVMAEPSVVTPDSIRVSPGVVFNPAEPKSAGNKTEQGVMAQHGRLQICCGGRTGADGENTTLRDLMEPLFILPACAIPEA
jgi:hypothetical protein